MDDARNGRHTGTRDGACVSTQPAFAAALLADNDACPPGLTAWNQSDPAKRFAIYRNNVIVSLIDALADTYPVTQELVGEEFFRAMARLFVRAFPPHSPVLTFYGKDFPAFIETFPPAQGLPYLADVARLEMLRVHAYHAADRGSLDSKQIAGLLANEAQLAECRFQLHSSVRMLQSAYAIVSLWAAHQASDVDSALSGVDPQSAETALVLRAGLEVEISHIPTGAARFIEQLRQGAAFGQAAETGFAADAEFDLASILGVLIRSGALCAVTISERSIS